MALKVRTMKLDDVTWQRWQREAKSAGVSLTALISLRMEAGPVVAKSKVAELEADIARLTASLDRVATQDAEIATLKKQLSAKPVNPALTKLRADPANKIIDAKASEKVGHPVMKDTVPAVDGEIGWCGLKGQDKPKGGKR